MSELTCSNPQCGKTFLQNPSSRGVYEGRKPKECPDCTRARRRRNNRACRRRARLRAREMSQAQTFVMEHPDLDAAERAACAAFLQTGEGDLTKRAAAVLKQHLTATRRWYQDLINRLNEILAV